MRPSRYPDRPVEARTPPTLPSPDALTERPTRLPDRYEDLGLLGRGGMGEVRRVRDRHLDRILAMKLLGAHLVDDDDARRAFLEEARTLARLQHPGIVSIHELGLLPNGQPWFTMPEVRGVTLGEAADARAEGTDPTWTLHRLVSALESAAHAVGYAHSMGVVHRDLSPANILVGPFGEVQVVDWGIAGLGSRATRARGTPGYAAPEQAGGAPTGVHADVYAVGAVLHRILHGRPPSQPGRHPKLPPPPAGLQDIAERATRRAVDERYPEVEAFARALSEWLAEASRVTRARALVAAAQSLAPRVQAVRDQAAALRRQGASLLSTVKPTDPVTQKAPAWALEGDAERLEREAGVLETEYLQSLRGALNVDAESVEAHELLADHYLAALLTAEAADRARDAAQAETLLAAHDRGRHSGWLNASGVVSLDTDPPGAAVTAWRLEEHDGRVCPVEAQQLGVTPLREVSLLRGSWLFELVHPDRLVVRYPVRVERRAHWDGVPPEAAGTAAVLLPGPGDLAPECVYVPPGWFLSGGDDAATDALPRRRHWVDGFAIQRFPVTQASMALFRASEGIAEEPFEPGEGPEHPMVRISWSETCRYADWLSRTTGRRWRLPHSLEWEKAARGVDGRTFPWGTRFDATFVHVLASQLGTPGLAPVGTAAGDVSIYGVRDTCGNARDWCLETYARDGLQDGSAVVSDHVSGAGYRVVRGGCWASSEQNCRLAGRFADPSDSRSRIVGFRLAYALSATTG